MDSIGVLKSDLNPVSFHQHSRFQRVTTFVFYNIPA